MTNYDYLIDLCLLRDLYAVMKITMMVMLSLLEAGLQKT